MQAIRYWVAAVGTLGSVVAVCFGLSGGGPGPRWVWILVAYSAIAFAGFMVWLAEREKVKRERQKSEEMKVQLVSVLCALMPELNNKERLRLGIANPAYRVTEQWMLSQFVDIHPDIVRKAFSECFQWR